MPFSDTMVLLLVLVQQATNVLQKGIHWRFRSLSAMKNPLISVKRITIVIKRVLMRSNSACLKRVRERERTSKRFERERFERKT